LEQALDIICKSAKAYFERDKDGVYHISAEPMIRETSRPAPGAVAGAPALAEAPAPAPPLELVNEKISLSFIGPDEVVRLLTSSHSRRPLTDAAHARSLDDLDVYPGLIDPTTGSWYL